MMQLRQLLLGLLGALCMNAPALAEPLHPQPVAQAAPPPEGLQFRCPLGLRNQAARAVDTLFDELSLPRSLVEMHDDLAAGTLTYTLRTAPGDTSTLDFLHRPEYWVYEREVKLPGSSGALRTVRTVSEKEILLALMQRGRLTEFSGAACNVNALREHMALRQHIAAWAEDLAWGWPDGGSARWNARYWNRGTPVRRSLLGQALANAHAQQDKYAIGCYTAAKLVYAHAVHDFYTRVRPDAGKRQEVVRRLWSDRDPLVGIEPGVMWNFEVDHDSAQDGRPGKLLELKTGVAPRNFVPGDWVYFLNTDPQSYQRTGYEGSNAIYLGRGRFSDYYNDNTHSYSFEQKLDEVFQWRNGVFSQSRHYARAVKLSTDELAALAQPPERGGLVLAVRAVPMLFGYAALPVLTPMSPPIPSESP